MVRDYPLLIERFPAYREQALKAQEAESELDVGASNKCQELEVLARNLEHEYLERLANYTASEQKRSHD